MITAAEQRRREELARTRTVHGWAFRGLPSDEVAAIRVFLAGGECPPGYEQVYRLCREQLKLPPAEPSNEGDQA